jgi:hypothetical protein
MSALLPPGVRHEGLLRYTTDGFEASLAFLWSQGFPLTDKQWGYITHKRDRQKYPLARPRKAPTTWKVADIAYLYQHYPTATWEELEKKLQRDRRAIYFKGRKLGLARRDLHREKSPRENFQEVTGITSFSEQLLEGRVKALAEAWGAEERHIVYPQVVNHQWLLQSTLATGVSHATQEGLRLITRTKLNVALFSPDLPYLIRKHSNGRWLYFVPQTLFLVPGPDGFLRGWNCDAFMDLEALQRVYGKAIKLPGKRTIHLPKPGPGKPRKDREEVWG